jgi:hypothetical protein
MTSLTRSALVALAALAGLVLTAVPAGATSVQCGDSGHCAGRLSHQAAPLEIAVAGPAVHAHAGTLIIGQTPQFKATGDWHLAAVGAGPDRMFKFAPRGNVSGLCITPTSDLPRSQLQLQPCVPGTAGASHQQWHPVNVIGGGFRVWRNDADGLVMTVAGTASGSPLQIRPMGAGTGGNKNFVWSVPF